MLLFFDEIMWTGDSIFTLLQLRSFLKEGKKEKCITIGGRGCTYLSCMIDGAGTGGGELTYKSTY